MPENSDIEQAQTPDPFEQRLQAELEALQKCQTEHQVKSCMECEKIIGCEVRERYVKAVYSSMNKGDTGGFEF